MKVTSNQLGLFIGCIVHITDQFLAEIEQLYNPAFDTKTDFILKSVFAAGFTIEAPDGISQKILSLADYGEKCKLVLQPVELLNFDLVDELASFITADVKGDGEIWLAARTAVRATLGGDVFNWIPVGLADAKNIKDLKLKEIAHAIKTANIIDGPKPDQKYWFYYPENDTVFCDTWENLDIMTAGHVSELCEAITGDETEKEKAVQILKSRSNA